MTTTTARPCLTPDLLVDALTGPLTVTRGYGLEVRESWGCGGTEDVTQLLSRTPYTYAQLVSAAGRFDAARRLAATERDRAIAEAVGPEPRFDANYTGTRRRFEKAHRNWTTRRGVAAERAASASTTEQVATVLGLEVIHADGVECSNSEYAAGAPVAFLGYENQHGCRCGHGGTTLLDPDDIDPDDPDEVGCCEPRPVAVLEAGPFRWLTTPGLLDAPDPDAAVRETMTSVFETWRAKIAAAAALVADLTAKLDALPTDAQMAEMGYADYQAAVQLNRQRGQLSWALHSARKTPEDLLREAGRQHSMHLVTSGSPAGEG